MKIRIELDEYVRMKAKIDKQDVLLDIIGNFKERYDELSYVDTYYDEEKEVDTPIYENDVDKAIKETYGRIYAELHDVLRSW